MTDQQLQQLLPDFCAGRLDPTLSAEIESRLSQSETLRQALEEARNYSNAVELLERHDAPDDFLDRVHEGIEKQQGFSSRLFRPFHIKIPLELIGVGATVVLLIFLFNPFLGRVPTDMVEPERAAYRAKQNRKFTQRPIEDTFNQVSEDEALSTAFNDNIEEARKEAPEKSISRPRPVPRVSSPKKTDVKKQKPTVHVSAENESEYTPEPIPSINKQRFKEKKIAPARQKISPSVPVNRKQKSAPKTTTQQRAEMPVHQPASGVKKDAARADYDSDVPSTLPQQTEAVASPFSTAAEDALFDADETADKSLARSRQKRKPIRKKRMAKAEAAVSESPLDVVKTVSGKYHATIDSVIFSDVRSCKVIVLLQEKHIAAFKNALSGHVTLISFQKESSPAADDHVRITLHVSTQQ